MFQLVQRPFDGATIAIDETSGPFAHFRSKCLVFNEFLQIRDDRFQRPSCDVFMSFWIRLFDNEHEMIDQRDETLQRRPTGETARFDACVQFMRLRGFKKRDAEVRLE